MYYVQINKDTRIGIDNYNTIILQRIVDKKDKDDVSDDDTPEDPNYKNYGYFGMRNLDQIARILISLEVSKPPKKKSLTMDTLDNFITKYAKAVSKITKELNGPLELLNDASSNVSDKDETILNLKKEIKSLKRSLTMATKPKTKKAWTSY